MPVENSTGNFVSSDLQVS